MKNLLLKSAFVMTVFLVSCNNENKTNAQIKSQNNANPETQKPNNNIVPAFDGQTRTKGVKTSIAYNVEVINSDLGRPWGIINLPDGRFLITEKSGFLQIVSKDGKTISKISGLPKVDDKGQGGLLDVSLDPDFQNNRMVFGLFLNPFPEEITLQLQKENSPPTKN